MPLDAFMQIEQPKLEGEGTDDLFPKAIEILSFDQTIIHGAQATDSSSDSTASKSKSEHQAVTIIKLLDQASPKLYQAASAGTRYKKVILSLCQPSGTSKENSDRWLKKPYLVVTLESVFISRVHLVGDPAMHYFGKEGTLPPPSGSLLGMGPMEEIDLTYHKIGWVYKGGSGNLNITGSWNLRTSAPV